MHPALMQSTSFIISELVLMHTWMALTSIHTEDDDNGPQLISEPSKSTLSSRLQADREEASKCV
jgi:hypothetical protein